MEYTLKKVELEDKEILHKLLQFALYDGSKYIDNKLNSSGEFEYKWLDNYFTDKDRSAYLIKTLSDEIIGFIMINSNLKFKKEGNSIAEFLILPAYRRKHIGQKVILDILNSNKGYFEIAPIENSNEAFLFWKNTIKKYTNAYELKENIFCIRSSNISSKELAKEVFEKILSLESETKFTFEELIGESYDEEFMYKVSTEVVGMCEKSHIHIAVENINRNSFLPWQVLRIKR